MDSLQARCSNIFRVLGHLQWSFHGTATNHKLTGNRMPQWSQRPNHQLPPCCCIRTGTSCPGSALGFFSSGKTVSRDAPLTTKRSVHFLHFRCRWGQHKISFCISLTASLTLQRFEFDAARVIIFSSILIQSSVGDKTAASGRNQSAAQTLKASTSFNSRGEEAVINL